MPGADSGPAGATTGLSAIGRMLLVLVRLLPKNLVSRWAGRLAGLRLPAPLQRAEIKLFARLAGVDLREAREPIEAYPTLQSFFVRHLKAGARPIEGDARTLVSPCDGAWGASGSIDAGLLLQVKGRSYAVADLLGDGELARGYEGGQFATLYLSPRDYHRFHTPIAGRIVRLDYWPGALWPVNSIGLQGVDRLFVRNERICAYLRPAPLAARGGGAEGDERGEGGATADTMPSLAMVAVGATMVGSVRLSFDALRTNAPRAQPARRAFGERGPDFERAQEWGHFEFGSTIVLLTPPGLCRLDLKEVGTPVRLGEAIGRISD